MKVTENFLTLGKRNRPGEKIIKLKAIVLHWLAAPNQRPVNTRNWWESEESIGSAHYVIGTDGEILQTLPEDEIGYHIGSSQIDPKSGKIYTDKARSLLGIEAFTGKSEKGFWITPNYFAIGIEMSHLNMNPGDFSEPTLQAAAELCADILKRHNLLLSAITTHNEIVGWKDCPKLWTDNPELFMQFKERIASLIKREEKYEC
jgi:N-acetylmuramoyl-L-alanine amidase